MTRQSAARFILASLLLVVPLRAQDDDRLAAMASWVALDVATGYETRVAPALAARCPVGRPIGGAILSCGSAQGRPGEWLRVRSTGPALR